MPKFLTEDQQSVDWMRARSGRICGSRIKDVLAFNKNGSEPAKRYNYRMDLIAERLTGQFTENYVSPAMQWGIDNEPWAIAAYELAFDVQAQRVGFAVHPALEYSGASPDALIGDQGVLEVKCPNTTTHLEWLMAGVVPEEHRPQMYWEMACCERQWCDFVSFDPRLPEDIRVFTKRLEYDQAIVTDIQAKVMAFHEEVNAAITKLRAR